MTGPSGPVTGWLRGEHLAWIEHRGELAVRDVVHRGQPDGGMIP